MPIILLDLSDLNIVIRSKNMATISDGCSDIDIYHHQIDAVINALREAKTIIEGDL